MLTDKWVTVDAIIERIARVHPDMLLDRMAVAEWCFDVVKRLGVWPGFEEVRGLRLDVLDKKAELPCNVYRLLSVRPSGLITNLPGQFRYHNDGRFVRINDDSTNLGATVVVIDALVFKVDDSGLPMIFEAAQEACHYYVLQMKMMDGFLSGSITPDRYEHVREMYGQKLMEARSATSRWRTRDEISEVVAIARSIVRPVTYTSLR